MEKMNVERFKRGVINLLQTSYIENWNYVEKFDIDYEKDLDKYFLNITFKDGLNEKTEEQVLDDCWLVIYNFFRVPVYLVNKSSNKNKNLREQNDDKEKKLKLLHGFMDTLEIEGICGYMITEDEKPQVIIIIDLDWLKKSHQSVSHIARKLRYQVKNEIEKWLSIDIVVGSTAKYCEYIN